MPLTPNKNYLSPIGFKLVIDNIKYANLAYFCSSAPLPAIASSEAQANFRGSQHAMAGDRIDYSPLDIRFMIDEDMNNYLEVFKWIHDNIKTSGIVKCDVLLHILTSKNNTNKIIRFVDAFPISLEGIEFNAQNSDVEYVQASCSFRYTRFEIE